MNACWENVQTFTVIIIIWCWFTKSVILWQSTSIDAFVRFILQVFVYLFRYFNNPIPIYGKTETAIQNSFPLQENY